MNFYVWFFANVWIAFGYLAPVFSKDGGKTWAVLFCGVDFYRYTYGMEAAVYKMYHNLINGGIPSENIVVLAGDGLAYHQDNVNPGSVLYAYNGTEIYDSPNYYENVIIDYSKIITPLQFMNILSGNSSDESLKVYGSGKVIKSGPKDNIFMYYQGILSSGGLHLNNWYNLHLEEFIPFLEKLKEEGKFDKMLWMLESNNPGFMFDNYLDTDKNILIYALGGRYSELSLCHYNSMLKAFTSICASSQFHKYFDKMLASNGASETIFDTFINERYTDWANYETVRNLYGNIPLAKDKISTYFGTAHKATNEKVDLQSLQQEAKSLKRTSMREAMMNDDTLLAPEERLHIKRTLENIIKSSIEGTEINLETILNNDAKAVPTKYGKCANTVTRAIQSKCFTVKTRFVMVFECDKFAKLCSLNIPEEKILSSINRHCDTQFE